MQPAPLKPSISFEDFSRVDVRLGTIVAVEEIPKSRSLMRLRVDLGNRTVQVIAGIKNERAQPEALAGVQALFVVNVEPRRLMGELSEAMLFDIGHADGLTPALAIPEHSLPNGARAG